MLIKNFKGNYIMSQSLDYKLLVAQYPVRMDGILGIGYNAESGYAVGFWAATVDEQGTILPNGAYAIKSPPSRMGHELTIRYPDGVVTTIQHRKNSDIEVSTQYPDGHTISKEANYSFGRESLYDKDLTLTLVTPDGTNVTDASFGIRVQNNVARHVSAQCTSMPFNLGDDNCVISSSNSRYRIDLDVQGRFEWDDDSHAYTWGANEYGETGKTEIIPITYSEAAACGRKILENSGIPVPTDIAAMEGTGVSCPAKIADSIGLHTR